MLSICLYIQHYSQNEFLVTVDNIERDAKPISCSSDYCNNCFGSAEPSRVRMLNTRFNKQKKSGDSLTPIVSIITDEGSAETKHLNHFIIATMKSYDFEIILLSLTY